jgi:predicted  nucleic acid-binding Zn-ribbon protein
VQKLDRKSREALMQLARGLADLSHLHSAALEGQLRFRQGTLPRDCVYTLQVISICVPLRLTAEIDAETARLQAARSQREATEQEQARLAQEEDFESADALNAVLDQLGADIQRIEADLRSLRASVRMLEETFAQERADAVSNLARHAAALKVTREQLELGAAQLERSADKQFSIEQARIAAELERIGLEKSHFEREEQALSEDSSRTEDAIQSQTGDLGERRDVLQEAIGVVDAEIRALQEQLAAKEKEKGGLTRDLEAVEGKIGEVRKKYDRQLQRIADRQAALQQSKEECLGEERAVLRDQDALQAQTEKERGTATAVRAWTQRIQSDVTLVDDLLQNLAPSTASGAHKGALIATISSVGESEVDPAADALRKNLDAIVFLSGKKTAAVSELTVQRDFLLLESRRLGDNIPLLEAEKKAHAASKRFKEAAAVAKDLKEQQTAKEGVDAELAATEKEIAHLHEEVEQLAAQEASTREALQEALRLRDVARFDCLAQRAKQVQALLAASGSRQAEDSGICVAVESFLATELDAVLKEGREIQLRHGLPTSLEDLLAEEAARTAVSGADTPVVDGANDKEDDQTDPREEGSPADSARNEERSPPYEDNGAVPAEEDEREAAVDDPDVVGDTGTPAEGEEEHSPHTPEEEGVETQTPKEVDREAVVLRAKVVGCVQLAQVR